MSGIFVAGYGSAFADILRDAKSVIEAEIHSALSICMSELADISDICIHDFVIY